ncbi:E3 ubiquitin-protein ligase Iruka [Contarinia nasturtii]|uniref:E3 ubiquitin-protein ligase Iruka n=1 Tax=Contarinia nasturtii TaxID=265458 RepID=UPI0012D4A279|nr:E3 ubiquitin-protein ligase Iruka [Contarinia nasturtii]XP_031621315.1 E3 ubiquitin-protein ligase Iruka [Contarinia nasturtii]
MAESVVAPPALRFYCHKCNVEIENVNTTEYTCPLCAGGFIEELPSNSSADRSRSSSSNDDADVPGEFNDHRLNERISSLLMSSIGGGFRAMDDDSDQSSNQEGSSSSAPRARRSRGRRAQDMPNFENIMQEFLISISGGAGNNVAGGGSQPMFFMGNPGDYAWGREGLDSVITQMLNQMENSGPPPLSKDKIQEIPRIEITDEQFENKMQCSVCWDNFERMELVRKLPCTHMYHEHCIVPWLELHGTCPVCRKAVDKDASDEQPHAMPMGNIANITNRIGNVYRTTFNFFNHGDSEQLGSVSASAENSDGNILQIISSQLQQEQSNPDQNRDRESSPSDSPPQQRRDRRTSSRRDEDGNVEFDCD